MRLKRPHRRADVQQDIAEKDLFLEISGRPTSEMTCFSIHGKHLLHVVPETAAEAPTEDAATYSTLITEGIRSSNVLLISDHGQGVIASETARTLIDTAQKQANLQSSIPQS